MARAQYVGVCEDNAGNKQANVPVTVNVHGGGAASIYSTEGGGTPLAGLSSDITGTFTFWADPAITYDILPSGYLPRAVSLGGVAGAPGPTGPALSVQGTYASGATYTLGQAVIYSSKLYVSLANANTGHQPDTNPTWWGVVTAPLQTVFNVRDYGGALDGTTDDTAAVHAARDAAAAVGGGDVVIPYSLAGCKTATGIQMKAGVNLIGGSTPRPLEYNGYTVGLIGTSTTPAIKLPNTNSAAERAACTIANLSITGCQDGIVAANGGTGLHLVGVYINPLRYGISGAGFSQSWTGDRVEIIGGTIAFYYPPTAGTGGSAARLDDADFSNFYLNGQTTNAINVDLATATSVSWTKLRIVTTAGDGIVLAGGLAAWRINGWNCEAIGYGGASSYVAPTTGTITLGAPTACTVGSGAGIANGATVTVRGAGANGTDLVSVVNSGGGTTSLVLATGASTAVSGAEVRIGTASELKIVTSARGTPQNLMITDHISGGFGNAGRGDCNLRYSIDNTPGALITLTGCTNTAAAQHYDPVGQMYFTDGGVINSIRRPPTVIGQLDLSPWIALPLATGWSTLQNTLSWRRLGKQIFLKGSVIAGAGATGTITTYGTAPIAPAHVLNLLGRGSPAAAVAIDATHITTNVTSLNAIVSFDDGVAYWTDS